jgi:phage shock protein C
MIALRGPVRNEGSPRAGRLLLGVRSGVSPMVVGALRAQDRVMDTMQTTERLEATPLRRCREGRILCGVAAGAASYLGVDVAVVRLALVALAVLGGFGVPLYVAAWLLVPEEGSDSSLLDQWLAPKRVSS